MRPEAHELLAGDVGGLEGPPLGRAPDRLDHVPEVEAAGPEGVVAADRQVREEAGPDGGHRPDGRERPARPARPRARPRRERGRGTGGADAAPAPPLEEHDAADERELHEGEHQARAHRRGRRRRSPGRFCESASANAPSRTPRPEGKTKATIETANESRKASPTKAGPPASAPAAERTSSQMPRPARTAMAAYQPSRPASGAGRRSARQGLAPGLAQQPRRRRPEDRGCRSSSPSGTSASSHRRASPLALVDGHPDRPRRPPPPRG